MGPGIIHFNPRIRPIFMGQEYLGNSLVRRAWQTKEDGPQGNYMESAFLLLALVYGSLKGRACLEARNFGSFDLDLLSGAGIYA